MDNGIFENAQNIITGRRIRAINENDRRITEINSKIPEINEINAQLFSTSKELFEIIASGQDVAGRVEKLRKKNLEAQELSRKLLTAHGYLPDYLDMHYECGKCSDTGYFQSALCDCFKKILGNLAAEKMNKTAQIKLSSFDTFSLNYYKDTDYIIMKRIFDFAKSYADKFSLNAESILMLGKTGLGKTHLSLAIANVVFSKGYGVIYDSITNILRKIEREHFGRSDDDTLSAILDCDLLILDDLGTEFHTPFYNSVIYTIINTRINYGKPTVMSTNLSLEQIKKQYDERVTSRITAVYKCLNFTGEDIRTQKRMEGTS